MLPHAFLILMHFGSASKIVQKCAKMCKNVQKCEKNIWNVATTFKGECELNQKTFGQNKRHKLETTNFV